MTMNVFAGRVRTRCWTWLMIFYFILALVTITVGMYLAFLAAALFCSASFSTHANRFNRIFHWSFPCIVVSGTLVLIFASAWYKIRQLRIGGGHRIAQRMRATRVAPGTSQPAERKLCNIVEEMAIATGLPVPTLYIMDKEQGINAFTAGSDAYHSVLCVTRGAIELLNREELQGLVAHEFSHIANGDTRLNTRLIGWVYGIRALYLSWTAILSESADQDQESDVFLSALYQSTLLRLMIFGGFIIAPMTWVMGGSGAFLGNCIKASVCRKREFLADTMAVRFTRNPMGLAGALKKIGGYALNSRIEHRLAAQVSHMCFSLHSGRSGSFLATHPPLAERIQRLDPSFREMDYPLVDDETRRLLAAEDLGAMFAMPASEADRVGQVVAGAMSMDDAFEHAVPYARALIASLPPAVSEAARKPENAAAVVLGLLIEHDPRQNQDLLELLKMIADTPTHDRVAELLPAIAMVPPNARLPLIDLCIPALRAMTPGQHQLFSEMVQRLINADNRMDIMEWALRTLLKRHLDGHFKLVRPKRMPVITSLEAVRRECAVLLAVFARLGRPDAKDRHRAFAVGAAALNLDDLQLPAPEQRTLAAMDASLARLNELDVPYKTILLKACALCITADQEITVQQGELLRVVADSLAMPMPPFLPGQPLAT